MAEHERADHFFHAPAVLRELHGERIEQFRVARLFPGRAEIIRAAHETRAEEMQPDAIYHDAGGEGIRGCGEPVGELEATTLDVRDFWRIAIGEHGHEASRNGLGGLINLAADEHARFGASSLHHAHAEIAFLFYSGRVALALLLFSRLCRKGGDLF